jgi:predicted GTPase
VTCQDDETIGYGLRSRTSDIRTVRALHPTQGHPIVFVDMPGFDDTNMFDMELLAKIAEWLVKKFVYNPEQLVLTLITL